MLVITTLTAVHRVDHTTLSWSPTALVLAVATSAHASVAIPRDEGTLSRGLRTPPLPGTHASVGDCWQNSKCCHLLIRRATQFPRHLRVAPDRLPIGVGLFPHPSSAASSAFFTVRLPRGGDNGVTSFIFWINTRDLGRACRPVVRHPRRGMCQPPVPDHVPFWSKPVSILGLSLLTTFISTSPGLTLSRTTSSRPP